jgi:hypothetical protein
MISTPAPWRKVYADGHHIDTVQIPDTDLPHFQPGLRVAVNRAKACVGCRETYTVAQLTDTELHLVSHREGLHYVDRWHEVRTTE